MMTPLRVGSVCTHLIDTFVGALILLLSKCLQGAQLVGQAPDTQVSCCLGRTAEWLAANIGR